MNHYDVNYDIVEEHSTEKRRTVACFSGVGHPNNYSEIVVYIKKQYNSHHNPSVLKYDESEIKQWVRWMNKMSFRCHYEGITEIQRTISDPLTPVYTVVFESIHYASRAAILAALTVLRYLYEEPYDKVPKIAFDIKKKHPDWNCLKCFQVAHYGISMYGTGHSIRCDYVYSITKLSKVYKSVRKDPELTSVQTLFGNNGRYLATKDLTTLVKNGQYEEVVAEIELLTKKN